jgi:hypothetical protein
LRLLIGAPELHHWHHSRERDAGNYANISPLMDLLFGTYRCPDHEPESLGLQDPLPRSYLGQLLHPFRPEKQVAPADSVDHSGSPDAGTAAIGTAAGCVGTCPEGTPENSPAQ